MRKALKILLIIGVILLSLIIIAFTAFFAITAGVKLDPDKLVDYDKTITVFDDEGNKIEDASLTTGQKSVKIENLNDDTINAFVASEDRNFFKHNGLNYKRIIKATYKNLISRSFKEGASTISQQLVKNTHLNNDKTITRKLKEIKLTKQLERKYSKNQILEMYLNTIYFGHNCFGLQSAANFYFDKSADELNLEQSATIVGLLASPNNYSPFKNPEKCLKRRNSTLKSMLECGYIDESVYESTSALPLSATKNEKGERNGDYLHQVFEEFEALEIDPYFYAGELKVKTYLNQGVQNAIESATAECDYSIFARNSEGGVVGFKSSIGNAARQIGSTAKPLFVYAPAIEMKKVNVFTKILDERIDYGGYSPENYDKKYHGKVTVAESIQQSYNVPAVKTLNALDMDEVQKYAKNMGIDLENEDKNLSLALGGMKNGLTLKQLCDGYSTFQNGGNFAKSRFISEICDKNGKILYKNQPQQSRVFSQGTASLINGVLRDTAKVGTAKKLKDFGFDVACKTGTCGNAEGNTDAYSVAYTSSLCLGVWLGDKDNKRLDITGGRDCCNVTKQIFEEIYKDSSPAPLDTTSGTTEIEIDGDEYESNDKILLCDKIAPKLNRLAVRCLSDNLPKETSSRFTSPAVRKPTITVNSDTVTLSLCQTKYYSYLIKRTNSGKTDNIYDGSWKESITDAPGDGEYEYTVTPYYVSGNDVFYGEEITLPRVIVRASSKDKIPDIVYKDWYNQ